MAFPVLYNNSPQAGRIRWEEFSIAYMGEHFNIPAGWSDQRWVWWRRNGGVANSVLEAGPDLPADLKDEDLVLFGNKNGIGMRVQTTSVFDGELLVNGSVFAEAIAANQITSTHVSTVGLDAAVIKFGTMSGDRITANTLDGNRIKANTILTSQLLVTDIENLLDNPQALIGNVGATPIGWSASANGSPKIRSAVLPDGSTGKLFEFIANGAVQDSINREFEVQPGDQFWVAGYVKKVSGTDTSGLIQPLACTITKTDGTMDYTSPANLNLSDLPTGVWVPYESSVTMPPKAQKLKFRMSVRADVGDGTFHFWGMQARRKNRGSLIVDGTIYGNHIETDSIRSNHIVTAGLDAAVIKFGSMSGDRITVDTLNGNRVTTGSLSTSKLTITSLDEYVENGYFDYGFNGWDLNGTSGELNTAAPNFPGHKQTWKINGTAARLQAGFPVMPGEVFQIAVDFYRENFTGPGGIRFQKSADGVTYTDWVSTNVDTLAANEWVTQAPSIQVPSDGSVRFARMRMAFAGSGVIHVGRVSVRKKLQGSLIVDGTIASDHIETQGLNANVIKFGEMKGDRIEVNTLRGDRLLVNSIEGDRIKANTIETGHITTEGLNANVIKFGTMEGDRIEANSLSSGHIVTDGLDAAVIKFGYMSGDRITAKTISSNHVVTAGLDAALIKFGYMNGDRIDVGTISADRIKVEELTASIIETGILQSQMTITGALRIGEGETAGWTKDRFWFGDGIELFSSDTSANRLEGNFVTSSIAVRDGLSIGGNADVRGEMVYGNGIADPLAKMSLGQTWPFLLSQLGDGKQDNSAVFGGLQERNADEWLTTVNYWGQAGIRRVQKATGGWNGDLAVANWATNFYPHGGMAVIGTDFYIVGSDASRNGFYIYRLNSTGASVTKTSEKFVGDSNVYHLRRPRIFTDGTRIGIIGLVKVGTKYNAVLKWYDKTTLVESSTTHTLFTDVGLAHIGDAYYGTGGGSTTRLWVSMQQGDSNMVRAFNPASSYARAPDDDFPRANNSTLIGLGYDTAQGRMVSLDTQGYLRTYSKYVLGGIISASYSWYDGDNSVYPAGTIINGVDRSGQVSGPHETKPAPLTKFTLAKRAWPTVTAPPAPDELVTDTAQVDKANRIGIYAALNGVPRLQQYLGVGVRALPMTDSLSTSGPTLGSSTVPSFATAAVPAPGKQRSAAGGTSPVWEFNGSGSGKAGPYMWDSEGRPLHHGEWSSVLAGNLNTGAWTTRSGWTQRNSAISPLAGIGYANGVFTVSRRGLYLVTGAIAIAGGANGRRVVRLIKNGSTQLYQYEAPIGSGALGITSLPINTIAVLEAGDTLTPQAVQFSGATLAWNTADENNVLSIFCIAAMP